MNRAVELGRTLVSEDEDMIRETARPLRAGESFGGLFRGTDLTHHIGRAVADLELAAKSTNRAILGRVEMDTVKVPGAEARPEPRFRPWLFWPVVLLTLIVLVGWVRGRYYLDKLFVNKDSYWIEFGSGDGVWVQCSPWVNDSPPVSVYQFGSYPRNNLFRILRGTRDTYHTFTARDGWRGFIMVSEQYSGPNGVPTRYRYFEVPYWFLAVVMAGPAAWAAWTAWRHVRSRRLPGRCVACGYDLRASTGRCPECGRPFTASPDAPSPPATCATGGPIADK